MKIWQRAHDRNISFAFFTLFRSIYLFKIASTRFRFSRESLPRKHATVTIVGIPFSLFRLPFVHPPVTCTWNDRISRWVTVAAKGICTPFYLPQRERVKFRVILVVRTFMRLGKFATVKTKPTDLDKMALNRRSRVRGSLSSSDWYVGYIGIWTKVFERSADLEKIPIYLTNALCVSRETVYGGRNCKK